MDVSRRDFLASGTLAAGASLAGTPTAAALVMLAQAGPAPRGFNPADPALMYDLVIANADVLDPSQTLRGRRDIGIKHGQIAVLSSTLIPADRATQRYDAAIFDYVEGPPVEFVDTRANKKSGTKKLVPVLTVKDGRPFGRPYPVPFRY